MDEEAPPPLVSFPPIFPPSGRRLSASFVHRIPHLSSSTQHAWVSLQGRLVNSDDASSALTIGGGLTPQLALAWDLFTPIHRFLIVAVIGVAVAESKKSQQIWQLKKSVELRDQVLLSMQEKLDNLCELVNHTREHSIATMKKSLSKNGELLLNESSAFGKAQSADCGYWLCDQHSDLFVESCVTRDSSGNDVLYRTPLFNDEQEERRMSDLSWASSVTSASDIQLENLALEQDLYNLKRDCEEKETKIKELTTLLNSSEVAKSKRVAELEDVIRRKNSMITKLKKELVVLEQKVVQLSRLGRPSFSTCDSHGDQLSHVRDNVLYDMEISTSPSSSDSDSKPLNSSKKSATTKGYDVGASNRSCASIGNKKFKPAKPTNSSGKALEHRLKSRPTSHLQKFTTVSSRPNQVSTCADLKCRR